MRCGASPSCDSQIAFQLQGTPARRIYAFIFLQQTEANTVQPQHGGSDDSVTGERKSGGASKLA